MMMAFFFYSRGTKPSYLLKRPLHLVALKTKQLSSFGASTRSSSAHCCGAACTNKSSTYRRSTTTGRVRYWPKTERTRARSVPNDSIGVFSAPRWFVLGTGRMVNVVSLVYAFIAPFGKQNPNVFVVSTENGRGK